jgi:signal peptidase I
MKDGRGLKACVSRCGVIALVLLSSGCVLRPIRVAGVAMEPTLRDGEWAFTTATFGRLGRGDIVAFKYPRDTTKTFVMRIVGLPGERIEIRMGTIAINGRAIDENYVERRNRSSDTWGLQTIPEGEYFVMGDNRRISSDSRIWGMVRRELIWAKVIGH